MAEEQDGYIDVIADIMGDEVHLCVLEDDNESLWINVKPANGYILNTQEISFNKDAARRLIKSLQLALDHMQED